MSVLPKAAVSRNGPLPQLVEAEIVASARPCPHTKNLMPLPNDGLGSFDTFRAAFSIRNSIIYRMNI
jgi:hypothetical protein